MASSQPLPMDVRMLLVGLALLAAGQALAANTPGAGEPTSTPAEPSGAKSARGNVTTAEDVLARARGVAASVKDKSMRVHMRVLDASGTERVRSLRGYELHGADERKVLWIFEAPADLAGTGFLASRRAGDPDELWVYFPGQRRVRRLSPALRRESFQGSQLTYEDLTALFFFDYEGRHRLLGERACDTGRCWVVETVLPEGEFAYRRLESWLDVESSLPTRVDFYGDELLKTMRVGRTAVVQGVPTILDLEMQGASDGVRTRVEFADVAYDGNLEPRLFTVEGLTRGGK